MAKETDSEVTPAPDPATVAVQVEVPQTAPAELGGETHYVGDGHDHGSDQPTDVPTAEPEDKPTALE